MSRRHEPPDTSDPGSGYPPFVPLPPPDRVASPLTGWTRAHWEALADHLLEAAVRYATPDFSQFRLPGRNSVSGVVSDGIEGFARTFLLAAFRIAGESRSGGQADNSNMRRLIERYSAGLAAGTDNSKKRGPGSGDSGSLGQPWPAITGRSQQMVEAAAIAVALHETRDVLWNALPEPVKDNVRAWLGGFVGKRTPANNWILFQVVTEQFLKSVDGPHDDAEIERGLDMIEDWYVGDGWYTDGAGQNYDYYIGWAMHLYPLLWTRIAGPGGDGGRTDTYRQRLRQYLEQYQYFVGSDGAPVHQGRSLTYRYACAAPLWLGELAGGTAAGATPLAPGQARRLASGAARYFTERGVPDSAGLLTLGWHGTFLPATQNYSGPGSPYWASKGFLGLLLPPDHPAWTDTEQPGPNDRGDTVLAMPAPGFLLHGTSRDGIVRLLNHGSDHQPPAAGPPDNSNKRDDPHYAKLAYSNRTGPGAAEPSWQANVDNHVAVLGRDGTASRRRRIERVAVRGQCAISRYADTVDGSAYAVTTAVTVTGPWEVRAHLVSGPAGTTVRDGGYVIADEEAPLVEVSGAPVPWALVTRPDGLASLVAGLHGWAEAGVRREAEANAFGPASAAGYLLSAPRSGTETVHVTLVALTADAVHPGALAAAIAAEVSGGAGGWRVVVRFPDRTAELSLDAP
ncbi:MAG: DUF2264 domain-containing protein [Nocardiopsaceae bacterium]|nr:DUF2264 domain-containing protein [Nocardiopsaceae bacterium]